MFFNKHLINCFQYVLYFSRRRLFLFLIIVCLISLYVIPIVFRKLWNRSPIFSGKQVLSQWLVFNDYLKTDPNIDCIERYVRPYLNEDNNFDSKIWRSYESDDTVKRFLPYVGNGKFAISVDNSDNRFNILNKRALDLEIPFHPMVDIDYFGANSHRKNQISKIKCFSQLFAFQTRMSSDLEKESSIGSLVLITWRKALQLNRLFMRIDSFPHFSFKRLKYQIQRSVTPLP